MSALTLDRHIVSTPGTVGGKPRIAGRRISVQDIAVWHLRLGKSTDEICAEYDLGLAEVHAALAYYYDHQGEIDQSLTARDEYVDGLRSAGSPTLGGVPGD